MTEKWTDRKIDECMETLQKEENSLFWKIRSKNILYTVKTWILTSPCPAKGTSWHVHPSTTQISLPVSAV